MKIFTRLLLCIVVHTAFLSGYGQSGCQGNLLTNSSGYYGGFESGGNSISPTTAGSDLYPYLPRNGSYQIVQNVNQLGGGGYLNITPQSGNYFLAAHTSNDETDRVWYANIKVVPGETYKFCTSVTLLKNLGSGANYILGLYVNGVSIGEGRVTFDWTQICGTYTVPAGVTNIELSIRDPKKGLFFVALDNICFSGPPAGNMKLGNQVWNDYDGDGKRDENEPGIPGAPIFLYTDNNGDNLPDGDAVRKTKSDEAGRYAFNYLPEGRYIVSMPVLPGYQKSPNTSTQNTSPFPDNNVDDDNNLVRLEGPNAPGGVLFTNAITLSENQEPTSDGDGPNGNLTMDLAECGNSWIGDFVWNDLNGNGIQDAGEPGINGVTVTITFPDGITATTVTHNYNGDGYYDFKNLGPGTYKITFSTPSGFTPSPALQGSDTTKDSNPINGVTYVTLNVDRSDFTIDAGFTTSTGSQKMTLGNLIWNDKNLNNVRDLNEPGIAGVTVKLYKDDNNDDIADGAAIATTTTDASGYYIFTNLDAGNYIVGAIIPVGNVRGAQTTADPDDNVDNDNNGFLLIGNNSAGSEVRSKAITLALGTEPTTDGDGSNGNLTLDIAFCQTTPPTGGTCPGSTSAAGYFGGFEAGADNFSTVTAKTDLSYGLPRNGAYEIVSNASDAGGGGYLSITPHSGGKFMLIHTSANANNRLWAVTVNVVPGETYNFCAFIANAKPTPVNGFTVTLNAGNTVIATGTAVYGWNQLCGTYTAPAGVTTVEFSIKDPNPGVGPSHFLALDDICVGGTVVVPSSLTLGNLVWNDKNLNNVRDAGEPGIAGATVKLYKDDNNDDVVDGAAIQTTTTDANGNYTFSNLAAGNYIVGVIIPTGNVRGAQSDTDPDNDADNDNNGAVLVGNNAAGGEIRSKAITLAANSEPTTDGDDANGNLTLDIALCEASVPPPPQTGECANTTSSNGYFGGFEAGTDNFSSTTAVTDLSNGLPANGTYEVVSDVYQAGGGGYLNVTPRTGSKMMLIHTSSNANDRLWATTIQVVPGQTYSFCASIANAKATPLQGFEINLTAGGTVIANMYADFNWGTLCGTYTAPAGVTSVELAIKDPNPGVGPSHFLALDDICISEPAKAIKPADRSAQVLQPIYPNPAGEDFRFNLKAEKTGKAVINVVNLNGKVIHTQTVIVVPGINSVHVDNIDKIAGGTYFLQVMVDGKRHSQMIFISR